MGYKQRDRVQGHRWLATWRVGGVVVLLALMAGFARQAFAGPSVSPVEPATHLQCHGTQYAVGEPLYDGETVDESMVALSPTEVANRIAAAIQDHAGQRVLDGPEILYESATRSDVGFVATDGQITMVISMEKHDRAGWRVEAIYECA